VNNSLLLHATRITQHDSCHTQEEEKLRQRETLFEQLQDDFKKLPVPVRRNTGFSSLKLNNAIFLQQFVYLTELALFERVINKTAATSGLPSRT
jgi:hypothetical protein